MTSKQTYEVTYSYKLLTGRGLGGVVSHMRNLFQPVLYCPLRLARRLRDISKHSKLITMKISQLTGCWGTDKHEIFAVLQR